MEKLIRNWFVVSIVFLIFGAMLVPSVIQDGKADEIVNYNILWQIDLPRGSDVTGYCADSGDIDGDGIDEIAFLPYDHKAGSPGDVDPLIIMDDNGTVLWETLLLKEECKIGVVDYDLDGLSEIFVGATDKNSANPEGHIWAFEGNGSQIFHFIDTDDDGSNTVQPANFVFKNIDTDPELELIVANKGNPNRNVYALDQNGSLIWRHNIEQVYHTMVADTNNDGDDEVILLTSHGRSVYVINPYDGSIIWQQVFVNYNRGAIGDLTGDGVDDIFIVSKAQDVPPYDDKIYAVKNDSEILWSQNINDNYVWWPILQEINGDNKIDVVLAENNRFFSLDNNGSLLWETYYDHSATHLYRFDINGDRTNEIVFISDKALHTISNNGTVSEVVSFSVSDNYGILTNYHGNVTYEKSKFSTYIVSPDTNNNGIKEFLLQEVFSDHITISVIELNNNFSTVYVDDDFGPSTTGWQYDHFDEIQDGIDAASEFGTVYVYNGTYYENIIINKTVNIIGENKNTTIIDGCGTTRVVSIESDFTNFSCFTVKNGTLSGISASSNSNSNVFRNIAENNHVGVELSSGTDNITIKGNIIQNNSNVGIQMWYNNKYATISGNRITNNGDNSTDRGIDIYDYADYNVIIGNYIDNNVIGLRIGYNSDNNIVNDNLITNNTNYGLKITQSSNNNLIYNNILSNCNNTFVDGDCNNNFWNISKSVGDNIVGGCYVGGNYWSDYNGTDTDNDGIGDTEIPHDPGDYLPLIQQFEGNSSFPKISDIMSFPEFQFKNNSVNISCKVMSDISIDVVKINITYPNGTFQNITMNYRGNDKYFLNQTYSLIGMYNYFIWANDTSGNSNKSKIHSFNITTEAYLEVSSLDIQFSKNNPEPDETIIIASKIHNIGTKTAENISISFYSDNNFIDMDDIDAIPPNSYRIAMISWVSEIEGIHLIKVSAQAPETNTAEATRSIIIGQGYGNINLTCPVFPSVCYPANRVKIQGIAVYNTTYGSGSPVAGADVTIHIQNQSGQWNGHTTRYGTFSIWITAPDTVGNYTVYIEVTDHTFSTTLQKTLQVIPNEGCDFPDLIISSLLISDDKPLINETISLTAQVKNIGNENATNVLLRFYDESHIIGNVMIPQLNTTEDKLVTINWIAQPIGSHTMKVYVDPNDNITECNENNNDFWPPKTIYVYPVQPDITPVDISLSDNTPSVGQPITISAHIYNIGGSPANDIPVEFYDNSTSIGNDSISLPGKHGNGWVSIPYVFASSGTHTIAVCADPDNLTAEFNEENNCYFEYFTVHPENPDIVISSVRFSDSTPLENENITIFATVENIGETNATNFSVSFSDDGDEFDERFTPFLGVGLHTEVNITWVSTPAGLHRIMVCGDSYDNISEFFENNNCKYRWIAVGLPCPDLQIFSTNISYSNMNPDVYENVTVSATIRNVDVDPAMNVNVTFLFDEVIYDVLFIPMIEGADIIMCNVSHAFTGIGSHVVRVKAYPGPGDPPDENPDNNNASRAILVGTAPDLTISPDDIVFSKSSPIEGEIVWVNATVHNIGNMNADQVSIGFFDGDPSLGGDLIGTSLISILAGENETVSMQWTAHDPGMHRIHVMADLDDQVVEFNEENNQAFRNITVISDDAPPEIVDMSSNVAYTGSAFSFTADVTDNIVVSSAFVEYWYGSGPHTNVSMNLMIKDTWEKTIIVDHTFEILHYVISACDFAGSWNNTGLNTVTVIDDVPPSFGFARASPIVQIVDYRVNISALVTDNIAVHIVMVNISGPPGFTSVNVSMNASGNDTFYYENNYSAIGIYNYSILVNDTSGNRLSSIVRQFEVVPGSNVTRFSQGWNFVSLPFNNSIEFVNTFILFDERIINWSQACSFNNPFNITVVSEYVYGWDRSIQGYTFADTFEPGFGYWVFAYEDCELWIEDNSPSYDDYITSLEPDWNTFGIPYDQPVTKNEVLVNGEDWDTAVANGWIVDYVYGWNRVTQSYDFGNTFYPGHSYWIYATIPCLLDRDV